MADLKVLTPLSASSGVAVSGSTGLIVNQGGITVNDGSLAVGAASLSSTSLSVGKSGAAGSVTVKDSSGNTSISLNATAGTISGSGAATFNSVSVTNNLTVSGDLTVNGSTTTINTANLLVEDAIIQLGSSSVGNAAADNDRGLVFSLTTGNKAMFWDDSAGQFAFASTTNTAADTSITPSSYSDLRAGVVSGSQVAAATAFNLNSKAVLSQINDDYGAFVGVLTGTILNDAFGDTATSAGFIVGNLSKSNGQLSDTAIIKAATSNITVKDGEIRFADGTNNVSLEELVQAAGISSTSYYGLRAAVIGQINSGQGTNSPGWVMRFVFSGSNENPEPSSIYFSEQLAQVRYFKEITGLSGTTQSDISDKLGYASFDVATKASGSKIWTNDLVSVEVSSSNSGAASNYWYPVINVSAPGLLEYPYGEGGDAKIRLIVVNDKSGLI